MSIAGTMLYLYEASGVKALVRGMGFLKLLGRLGDLEQLAPSAEPPFFFSQIGRTFPAQGERRYRVAMMAGMHRQRGVREVERGDRPRAAEERLRGGGAGRIKAAAARCTSIPA